MDSMSILMLFGFLILCVIPFVIVFSLVWSLRCSNCGRWCRFQKTGSREITMGTEVDYHCGACGYRRTKTYGRAAGS
jgi:hypothetical protein